MKDQDFSQPSKILLFSIPNFPKVHFPLLAYRSKINDLKNLSPTPPHFFYFPLLKLPQKCIVSHNSHAQSYAQTQ